MKWLNMGALALMGFGCLGAGVICFSIAVNKPVFSLVPRKATPAARALHFVVGIIWFSMFIYLVRRVLMYLGE
jgi:hypothetical protein